MPTAAPVRQRQSVLERLAAALSLAVPLLVTALRATATPNWRDDLSVVRGLGFVPTGGQGAPSALAMELLALLPIGGRVLRAGLVGALAAGLAGYAVYVCSRDWLRRTERFPRLDPLLSLAAALTTTLSPAWQAECVAPGGVALAAAFGLFGLSLAPDSNGEPGSGLLRGAAFGLLLAESRLAALALGVALFARVLAGGVLPKRRAVFAVAVGILVVWLFCLVPLVVRPHAAHAWVSFGPGLSGVEPESGWTLRFQDGPFAAWASQTGPIATVFGLFGLVLGVVRPRLRASAIPLGVLVVADWLFAARRGPALSVDPTLVLRLSAVAGLCIGAGVGVRAAARGLERLRIPFASSATVLLVVYNFTLVFTAAETSADAVLASDHLGADVWVDEALGELPPNSLVLVRTPTLAFRLWAARTSRGERPDLVVVPLGLLGRGTVARALCEDEPALTPLVRDFAMTGRTGEFALSTLADARPLYVELDPDWGRTLLTHLRPTALWLGFEPHTLGRSDRARSLADESGRRALRRVLGAARNRGREDRATLAVLGAEARERAVVLAALGDRDNARQVLADLARMDDASLFTKRLLAELDSSAHIETRTLLE